MSPLAYRPRLDGAYRMQVTKERFEVDDDEKGDTTAEFGAVCRFLEIDLERIDV